MTETTTITADEVRARCAELEARQEAERDLAAAEEDRHDAEMAAINDAWQALRENCPHKWEPQGYADCCALCRKVRSSRSQRAARIDRLRTELALLEAEE